jgi:hypothetical protein
MDSVKVASSMRLADALKNEKKESLRIWKDIRGNFSE